MKPIDATKGVMGIDQMKCPRCGGECRRDEVHNGVAWLYGPWGCFDCGWSEWEEYDQTKIEQPKDGHIDQWGGFTRRATPGTSAGGG